MTAPQRRLLLDHLQFEAHSLVMVGHTFSFSVMLKKDLSKELRKVLLT